MFRRLLCLIAVSFVLPEFSHAAIITYTDRATFDADLLVNGYSSATLDFESPAPGTPIPSGGALSGISFNYNFGAIQLKVSNIYDTTSGTNFLGTNDGSDLLQDGDDFSMSFTARTAIGLYLISSDVLFDGDFTLTVGGTTASLVAADVQQTLPDLVSNVYFLGLIADSSTFTSAVLETHGGGGAFTYNVDDIITATASSTAVPEPASAFLIASLTCTFWSFKNRRKSNSSLATSKV